MPKWYPEKKCCIFHKGERDRLENMAGDLLDAYAYRNARFPHGELAAEIRDKIRDLLKLDGAPPKDADTSPEYKGKGDGNPMESK